MRTISGYEITEQMYESENSIVYRGYREADEQPVILKLLKDPYPSPEMIAWFSREYEIIHNLNVPGIVTAYALENDQHSWIMVLEDFGGESLRRLDLVGKLSIERFLQLAIDVTERLGYVHQQHIMHKDINPANIVMNPVTEEIKIIDFGIATVLSRENPSFLNPNVLEGTLAYMSPEQTGRMNRAMDYRTDFYSLGVTFYELLTGFLPFVTDDVLEMVHCHIAKQPTAPHQRVPEVPEAISSIIMKLIGKNAEDRYQSAHGLKSDLEECLQQWRTTGAIQPFPLGQNDLSDRFHIPQKLYGREWEINTLLSSFERVSRGACEIMLVAGYPGIGKSALVQEIYKPITRQRGYLITGKFDQFQRDTPYSAIIQAFRSLVQQLLTESDRRIAKWRKKILAAVGTNGQIITEVIPEMELIIGSQTDVVTLGPSESQNRFNLVFQNFIKVFTNLEHPLVMFIDDLQWADGASLKLIEMIVTAHDTKHLFVIGAYRDNEVTTGNPLLMSIEAIKQTEAVVIQEITLMPLDVAGVTRLVADTLHCTMNQAQKLAELLVAKTDGNPFFLNEFLKSLYVEELITFDYEERRWSWQLDEIEAREMTDNVVELMASKVQQLDEKTQSAMKLAACIGNRFDLMTLSMIADVSSGETARNLNQALIEGLIVPLGDAYKVVELNNAVLGQEVTAEYKFAHDRIQQAVYSLIPEDERQAIHWRLGQLLLQHVPHNQREEHIFDIVNQLNQGLAFIQLPAERDHVMELNMQAGIKAKASAAFQPAFRYLLVGESLVDPAKWHHQYKLVLELYVEAAEAAYLIGNFEEMERLVAIVLEQAVSILDKVKVYEVKIRAYIAQSKQMEAVRTALHVLHLLGIHFPERPDQSDTMHGLQETQLALAGKQKGELLILPEMTDPYKLAGMRILTNTINAAYVAMPELMSLITFKMTSLSVNYGYTSVSAHAYASYGLILCGDVGDVEAGYRFGQLALFLLDRFNAQELRPRTLMVVNNFIRHWKEHAQETLHPLLEAYQTGIEIGDFEFAAIAVYVYSSMSYFTGKPLVKLEQEMATYSDVLSHMKQKRAYYMNALYHQIVLNLLGKGDKPQHIVGNSYNEKQMLPDLLAANDRTAIYYVCFNKLILCYLFGDYTQAVEYAIMAERYARSAVGSFSIALFHFYDSLARLAIYDNAQPSEQANILEKVVANQKKLKQWALYAPMNHLHKWYLVEAEQARVLQKPGEAREYYDQAITLAQKHEYTNEVALACELAAHFYMTKEMPKIAQPYMRDAHYTYQQWGAKAKVKDLETRYQHMLIQPEFNVVESSITKRISAATTRTTATTTGQNITTILDLPSVLKASQAISGEIVLDSLLSKMMRILIENAGAERGALILDRQGQWVIEAEGSISSDTVTVLQAIPINSDHDVPLPTTLVNYVARTRQDVVIHDASIDVQFTQDPYITQRQPRSMLCSPLINQGKLMGILYLENNLTAGAFTADRLEMLGILSSQVAISIENARLYNTLQASLDAQVKLTNAYSRFVPREILQFLGRESITDVQLGDQIQQEMTVLFSDIRAFTSLSEQMSPQENFDFINAYLGRVSPIIRQYNGFIDKYIGDAIMALFPGHADDAIRAAIEMQHEVERYNKRRAEKGYQIIRIGVGLHTGNVMLGTVGEEERMEGTVISDTVNLASRLEGLNKVYGSCIIVSESTLFKFEHPEHYHFCFLDQVRVKGKKDPVSVFEILDGHTPEVLAMKMKTHTEFEVGLFYYHCQKFETSIPYFQKVIEIDPDDKAAQHYLQRATNFLEYGVPVDWEGIDALTEK